jgi:O-antigen/teichoic acid export membrane protein
MNTKKILKNASYLFISDVLIRFISAFATILIARYLDAHEYGILSLALAFSTIAGYFTDIGLTQTLTREATKKEANLEILISSFFRTKLVLAGATIIASFFLIDFLYNDPHLKSVISWVVYPTIIGSALFGPGVAYFQVTEKMHITALFRLTQGLFTSIALFCGLFFMWPLDFIAPIYGLSNIVVGILSIIVLARTIKFYSGWNPSIINGIYSFSLNGLIVMTLPQLGPIILEKVATLKEVGYFSAAYRIPSLLYQIPGVIAVAFYPKLFSYGNRNLLDDHFKLNTFQLKLMSFTGFLVSFPFIIYPNWWISILFGEDWLAASPAASILAIMVILQSINIPIGDHLTTKGHQNKRTEIMFFAFIVGMIGYWFLGKHFGLIGAAWAAILTESFTLICFTFKIQKGFYLLYKGVFINVISFSLLLIILFYPLHNIHPIIGMVIGTFLYLGIGIILDKEIRLYLIKLIKNRSNLNRH